MKTRKYKGYRPTWAEVNLRNLLYNFKQVKRLLAPQTKIMVTVKADAYGHGLIPVASKLAVCGADFFGVASIDEGILLRKAGIKLPILVLGVVLKENIKPLFKYGLVPTVCSEELASSLNREASKTKKPIKVHVKIDTGMGRIGVMPPDAESLIKRISRMKFISIEGIFTHFAFADMNRKFTLYQISLFSRLISKLSSLGIKAPLLHCANSMGIIDYRRGHFNMVRPGLVIYGLYPKAGLKLKLKPVLSLKSRVVYCKRVPKGQGISYGHSYITKRDTLIATLPIGYGDGYPRNLSNVACVLIGGKRFKISGKVCMDQIMVDVGDAKVKIGDEVVLIGSQGRSKITSEELAGLAETISYEIVCGLGSRVPRIYI